MRSCNYRVIFATASPRRKQLAYDIASVKNGIVTPVFVPSDVDETSGTGQTAEETARINARLKAEYAAARHAEPVIAFDTVVGVDGEVLGKPKDFSDALRMFKLLCGNTHSVITAVCVITGEKGEKSEKSKKIAEGSATTYVTFEPFDAKIINSYIESGAPFDKAGGYNIADRELAPIVAGVVGGIDNVVGLPVKLSEKLIEENILYGEAGNSH